VISAAPDIVIGSWCGKKFRPERVAARAGFAALPAVRDHFVREIKSTIILQPGPAALTDGLDAIEAIVNEWRAAKAPTRGAPILRTG
jgi:iron complex transport system substrate-binding protein